jgi:hypothetical protein
LRFGKDDFVLEYWIQAQKHHETVIELPSMFKPVAKHGMMISKVVHRVTISCIRNSNELTAPPESKGKSELLHQ